MRHLFIAIIFVSVSVSTAFSAEKILDGTTVKSFDATLNHMAASLAEEDRQRLTEALIKIGMTIDVGEASSRDEIRILSQIGLSKLLDGKSFADIIEMANNLPDDERYRKALERIGAKAATPEYQHDADIVRLRHLKYLGGLIESYHKKTGHYPLADNSSVQKYVYIASPQQEKYTMLSLPVEHKRVELELFRKELEAELGRKIEFPYDPQLKPTGRPNFYVYIAQNDGYLLLAYLDNGSGLGKQIGPNYYKVGIGNVSMREYGISAYNELVASSEFIRRIQQPYKSSPPPRNPEQAADLSL